MKEVNFDQNLLKNAIFYFSFAKNNDFVKKELTIFEN